MLCSLTERKGFLVGCAILSSLIAGWLSPPWAVSAGEEAPSSQVTFYVSAQGNDEWSGLSPSADPEHRTGPWRTLAPLVHTLHQLAAKDAAVTVKIVFGPGRLELSEPITLRDLPKSIAGLEFEAETPGSVVWSGGRLVTNWKRAREAANVSPLLPEEAREHVFIADLKELGVSDYGSAGGGGLELFYHNRRMTLARWPNEGFAKILDVLGEEPIDVRGAKGDKVGKFIYEGDRPSRWLKEKDPWVHGYWFWDWSDQRHPIAFIDPNRSLIAVKPPYHSYGYRKGQWWYAFNLLSELDAPGEYYLDRETGQLYFWPPDSPTDPAGLEDGQPTVSVSSGIMRLVSAKNVALRGLQLAHCRGTALVCENCENCLIENCEFFLTGGWAVQIRGGQQCVVRQSHLHELGEGGVSATGGDRATLSPAGHIVEDNEIHDYGQIHPMYRAGVSIGGVGQHVLHNHIHHAPHQAVGFSGNNHTIAWNEINHVCLESNDAGAIYSGRDWTMRGTVISFNYFHHISGFQNRGCMGVYLDDMFCGTQIVKNIFYRVTRAAFIGGGRDNLVENNIFIDCRPAVHIDARALGWASYHVPTTMTQRLKAMPYQSELWRKAYPTLINILEDEPAAPKGNIIRKNFCFGGTWDNIETRARPYLVIENNVILPLDAVTRFFVNPGAEDWRLKPDAPVRSSLPGFEAIPFEKIGPRRADLPPVSWRRHVISARLASYEEKKKDVGPERWESAIRKFEEVEKLHPPPEGAILFVGSSSIVRWDVSRWFPDWITLNRGFGGSQIHEVTYYTKRIVIPYHPRLIVFYAGDNDIAAGASPETVCRRFADFLEAIRSGGVNAPVIFIGIKPSLARWHLIDRIRGANHLIEEYCRAHPELNAHFLDVEKPMLGPDGLPQPELFVNDGLHLSDKGYQLWSELLKPVAEKLLGDKLPIKSE